MTSVLDAETAWGIMAATSNEFLAKQEVNKSFGAQSRGELFPEGCRPAGPMGSIDMEYRRDRVLECSSRKKRQKIGRQEDFQLEVTLPRSQPEMLRFVTIRLNGEQAASFKELQSRLIQLGEDGALRDVIMTLDCDSNLKYESVIAALDHVTAYRDAAGRLHPLVASTRFSTRR